MYEENPDILVYRRYMANEELIVFCNFKGKEVKTDLEMGDGTMILGNYAGSSEKSDALRPYEIRVYLVIR